MFQNLFLFLPINFKNGKSGTPVQAIQQGHICGASIIAGGAMLDAKSVAGAQIKFH